MADHDRTSEISVREAMGARFVPPPEYDEGQAAVAEIVTNVAVRKDSELPWNEDNRAKCRAVMVTGLTRAGKTDFAAQLAVDVPELQSVDGAKITHRPLYVECPSTFSQGLLFNLILKEFLAEFGSKRLLSVSAAYDRIDRQMPVHRPTLLTLDEFQYAANPSGVGAARRGGVTMETFGFIRHLLDHAAWPLPILLVGLPEIASKLDEPQHQFLNEKITRIHVAPMVQGSIHEIELLQTALAAYCEDAGIENGIQEEDIFRRLIHASDHARGLALELCQSSVMCAWQHGLRAVQMVDFAARYRISTGAPDDQNPFIVEAWHNTDRSRLARDSQKPEAAKTPKRKA